MRGKQSDRKEKKKEKKRSKRERETDRHWDLRKEDTTEKGWKEGCVRKGSDCTKKNCHGRE